MQILSQKIHPSTFKIDKYAQSTTMIQRDQIKVRVPSSEYSKITTIIFFKETFQKWRNQRNPRFISASSKEQLRYTRPYANRTKGENFYRTGCWL